MEMNTLLIIIVGGIIACFSVIVLTFVIFWYQRKLKTLAIIKQLSEINDGKMVGSGTKIHHIHKLSDDNHKSSKNHDTIQFANNAHTMGGEINAQITKSAMSKNYSNVDGLQQTQMVNIPDYQQTTGYFNSNGINDESNGGNQILVPVEENKLQLSLPKVVEIETTGGNIDDESSYTMTQSLSIGNITKDIALPSLVITDGSNRIMTDSGDIYRNNIALPSRNTAGIEDF